MVAKRDTSNLPAMKAAEARPAHLGLELLQAEAAGIQQRRRGTSRDVIAGECERVEEQWKSEHDAGSAYSRGTE